jgi:hypothetical protein
MSDTTGHRSKTNQHPGAGTSKPLHFAIAPFPFAYFAVKLPLCPYMFTALNPSLLPAAIADSIFPRIAPENPRSTASKTSLTCRYQDEFSDQTNQQA